MSRSHSRPLILATLLMLCPALAAADPLTIVDTGTRNTKAAGVEEGADIAGEFNVTDPVTITGIEAWFIGGLSGDITISLYADDNADSSVPGSLLFSQNVGISVLPTGSNWYGTNSLHWNVGPGSYWAAFEQADGLNVIDALQLSLNALSAYALRDSGESEYVSNTQRSFALRVVGEPISTAVPEPSALVLLSAGLAVALCGRKRVVDSPHSS